MWNRMHRAVARPLPLFVLLSLAWLFLLPPQISRADVPPGDAAWVCVTEPEFVDAFTDLASYREGQGLSAMVVTMDDVRGWAVGAVAADTPSSLRWFARRAVESWGTRYLLIGADHDRIPAPHTRRDLDVIVETAPLDLYYACLDGDWNGDGDEWVAEPEDAYDHEPDLAVGRFPVDDAVQAAAVVAKTVAYEGRSLGVRGSVLLSGAEFQQPTPVDDIGARHVADLAAVMDAGCSDFDVVPILQNRENAPEALELTPEELIAQLAGADYDHVHHFSQGVATSWVCGEGRLLGLPDVADLAGSGRTFVFDAAVARSADIADEGVLEAMIAAPDGGAVAARGLAITPYVTGLFHFSEAYWEVVASGAHRRLGDVHHAALVAAWDSDETPSFRDHLPLHVLLGDPALVVRPPATTAGETLQPFTIRGLDAFPNPFNPSTVVAFAVDGPGDGAAPVRVEIFDVRGRRVAVLLDGDLPVGDHKAVWSAGAGGHGAGVFFARVSVGGSIGSVKLVRVD